jgi:serine/tyrosine/threonine adenylyltransferase
VPRRHAGDEPGLHPAHHLVEGVLSAARNRQDLGLFEELLEVLSQPYEERKGFER